MTSEPQQPATVSKTQEGKTTSSRHSRAFFQAIGREGGAKGGQTTRALYGPDFYRRIGKSKKNNHVKETVAQFYAHEIALTELEALICDQLAAGKSFAEIGQHLGVSRQRVHQRYQKILLRLPRPDTSTDS